MDPYLLPSGYGFRKIAAPELRLRNSLLDLLMIWEPPRRRGPRKYIVSADVSDGLGLDRSVVEVLRVGTIEEPTEQVAEWASDSTMPVALAYVIQSIGQYYKDDDGVEALVAVEGNNHGLSTQDTLQLHLGYTQFYRWEYYDAANPADRYSTKIGWYTSTRTRPIMLDKLYSALTTRDAITGLPDLITHSSLLHEELKDFQTMGELWEAKAAAGAHDDFVMSLAIGNYVCWRKQGGELEPLEERRRRKSEQQAILKAASAPEATVPDWRNTPATTAETDQLTGQEAEIDDLDALLYDPRQHDDSGWG